MKSHFLGPRCRETSITGSTLPQNNTHAKTARQSRDSSVRWCPTSAMSDKSTRSRAGPTWSARARASAPPATPAQSCCRALAGRGLQSAAPWRSSRASATTLAQYPRPPRSRTSCTAASISTSRSSAPPASGGGQKGATTSTRGGATGVRAAGRGGPQGLRCRHRHEQRVTRLGLLTRALLAQVTATDVLLLDSELRIQHRL